MPFIRCVYSGEKEAKDDIIVAISSAAAAALEKVNDPVLDKID
jgi:phenylpyruvate tautomerase PptA (4-oxalocrotonate tautomerase family)